MTEIFRGKLVKSHGEKCNFCECHMLEGQRAVIWQHRKDEVRMAHEECYDQWRKDDTARNRQGR